MQTSVIGEKVNTEYGVFEIIDYNNIEESYFCYQKGFDGHSGIGRFGEKYLNTKYEGNCWWFDTDEVSLIKESKVSNLVKQELKDYRKMKPTDLIDITLDGKEFKVPLGDLVCIQALIGRSTGKHSQAFYDFLYESLGCVDLSSVTGDTIYFSTQQKQAIDYFFKPHYDENEKKELEAQIVAKSNELLELQAKLKDLQS